MRAVIFAGGNLTNYRDVEKYIECSEVILCADSGFRHALAMGVVPDMLLGDMDSIDEGDLERAKSMGVRMEIYPKEKDYTDTMLALKAAAQLGVDSAFLMAGLGDRPDHSIANILLMVEAEKMGIDLYLVGEGWEMSLIFDYAEIEGKKGDLLSLIPLSPLVEEVQTRGLFYSLERENIPLGTPRGISNVFTDDRAVIRIKAGILLAVKVSDHQA